MAGAKGKSGGARSGAGRKPKAKAGAAVSVELESPPRGGALKRSHAVPVLQADKDMLQFLQDVALGKTEASGIQVRAAIAAVQYTHTKKGDGGKKDEVADKAKTAGAGKFRAAPAPLKLIPR